ncbi:MAG: hypothetical protein ABIO85_01240 [Sphingomicrobium sp.]
MRLLFALFALLTLTLTPLVPAVATTLAPDHCVAMSHHGNESSAVDASAHQCCTPAMPALPDRAAEVGLPSELAYAAPVATALTLTLSNRPQIELRPPRTA